VALVIGAWRLWFYPRRPGFSNSPVVFIRIVYLLMAMFTYPPAPADFTIEDRCGDWKNNCDSTVGNRTAERIDSRRTASANRIPVIQGGWKHQLNF